MINGAIVDYTRPDGRKVETRALSNPFEFNGKQCIYILGERLPVLLDHVKESQRFIAAKRFYARTI